MASSTEVTVASTEDVKVTTNETLDANVMDAPSEKLGAEEMPSVMMASTCIVNETRLFDSFEQFDNMIDRNFGFIKDNILPVPRSVFEFLKDCADGKIAYHQLPPDVTTVLLLPFDYQWAGGPILENGEGRLEWVRQQAKTSVSNVTAKNNGSEVIIYETPQFLLMMGLPFEDFMEPLSPTVTPEEAMEYWFTWINDESVTAIPKILSGIVLFKYSFGSTIKYFRNGVELLGKMLYDSNGNPLNQWTVASNGDLTHSHTQHSDARGDITRYQRIGSTFSYIPARLDRPDLGEYNHIKLSDLGEGIDFTQVKGYPEDGNLQNYEYVYLGAQVNIDPSRYETVEQCVSAIVSKIRDNVKTAGFLRPVASK